MNAFKLYLADIQRLIKFSGFWSKRTLFYKDLASALQRNELVDDFIQGELTIATNKSTYDKHRVIGLNALSNSYSRGANTLGTALMAIMPKSDHLALSVFDKSLNQVEVLKNHSANVERLQELTKVIRTAAISPLIMLPLGFIFIWILATNVIPEFAKAAPPEVWESFFNGLVKSTAEFIKRYGLWIFTVIFAVLVWLFTWALSNLTSGWRFSMDTSTGIKKTAWSILFPFKIIFSFYRDIEGARLLSSLATLLQSGMLLTKAVESLQMYAQPWMRKHLQIILEHRQISPSENIESFGHGVIAPSMMGRLATLSRQERTGFENALIEAGTLGMNEAREAIKATAVAANALIMICVVSIIMFFYGGITSIALSLEEANSPVAVAKRQKIKNVSNRAIINPVTK